MILDWRNQDCKMTVLPKAIYGFDAMHIKLQRIFLTKLEELEQNILKSVWKHKRPQKTKEIFLKKEMEASAFLTSNNTTKLQLSKQYGTGTKRRGGSNIGKRTESPEINLSTYAQLIYDKGGKTIQWKKDSLFNKWF